MFRALILGFGQLSDPRTRRIVWISIAGAILGLIGLIMLANWGLGAIASTGYDWLDFALKALGWLGSVYAGWVLFPSVVVLISSLYLDRVVAAVEARWYPGLPPAPGTTIGRDIRSALRFGGLALLLNLVALPVYLMLPGLNFFLFYALNGYLFGREYYDQIAARRLSEAAVRLGWRHSRARLWTAGGLIAVLGSIPIVNLLMPIVATAFMVHMFEDLRRRASLA